MDNEYVRRMKNKLILYGSYTREIQKLERRLFQITEAKKWHDDWPEAAAKECGIHSPDVYHTATQQMTIEQASLAMDIDKLYDERAKLNLDSFMSNLQLDDYRLIWLIYVEGYTQQEVAPQVNLTRSGVKHRVNAICTTRPAGR